MLRFVVLALAISVSGQAHADVKDYCAAYARDFADHVQKQNAEWQPRYDNAEASCLARLSYDVIPPPKAKTKPKVQKAVSQKPPKVAPAPVEEVETEAKAMKPAAKPETGSPEWLAYCQKKYVSFDAAKGTYLSKTGVERKCLVTADPPAPSAKAEAPKKPPAKPPAKR
jgi:BA14K-like protein